MENLRTLVSWRLRIPEDHLGMFQKEDIERTGYIVGLTKSPHQNASITRSGGPGSTVAVVVCDQDNRIHELYLSELTVIK